MKKKLKFLLLGIVLLLFSAFTYWKVVVLPFPFIEMKYSNLKDFYSKPEFVLYEKPIDSLINEISVLVKKSREIGFYGSGNKVRSENDILVLDKNYKEICSELSKILFYQLKKDNISSRVVWMNGHTVTEVYHQSTGWFLVDPYGDIIIKDCQEDLLNLIEIKNTTCLDVIDLTPDKDFGVNYKTMNYLTKKKNVFKDENQNLYVVIDENYIFDFHKKTNDIKEVFLFTFSIQNNIGKGEQLLIDDSPKVGNFGLKCFSLSSN